MRGSCPPSTCTPSGRCRATTGIFRRAGASSRQFFAKSLPATEWRSAVHKARHERGIWQRRYWEHLIRDEKDYLRHVHYCYFNPVKHGLVANVEDWPYSTFHRDMTTGFDRTDWEAIDGRKQVGRISEA
jgi:hypothetical protein